MNIPKEVYKLLKKHCKDDKNILGAHSATIKNMKAGRLDGMTTTTLKNIFNANGIEARLEIKHNEKGVETTTIINF